MNDTNNINGNGTGNENVAVTPVQENVAPPAPVAEQPVSQPPIEQSVSSPEAVNASSTQVDAQSNEEKKVEDAGSGVEVNATEVNTPGAKLSFPTIVVVLIAVLGVLAALYFFVLIKPKNVYVKLLKTTADNLLHLDSIYKINEPYTNYSVVSKLTTAGASLSAKENLGYLDGLEYYIDYSKNNNNDSYMLSINSNLDSLSGREGMKYNKKFTANAYFIDDKLYYKTLSGRFAEVSEGSTEKNQNKVDVINDFINNFIDSIDINKVTSELETVAVNNQTILTISYKVKFNNEELNKIFQTALEKSLNDEEFINKILKSDIMDVTAEEVKAMLEGFKAIELTAENVEFNYNVNLAFTDMIAMELVVDDTTFSVSTLNSMYYITSESSSDDKLNIDLAFNANTNEINGSILVDNKNAYSYVEILSESNRNKDTYHLEKLTYDIKLYGEQTKGSDKKSDKPYLTLNNVIKYNYDEKQISVGNNVVDIEEVTTEEDDKINYVANKFVYELSYLVALVSQNRAYDNPKEYLESIQLGSDGYVDDTPEVEEDVPVVDEPVVEDTADANQTLGNDNTDVVVDNSSQLSTPAE